MITDDFQVGSRVLVCWPDNVCHNIPGTVLGRDAYTVRVRLDRITPEMEGYEDARTGVCEFDPEYLVKL